MEGWAIHENVLDSHMFEITKGANHWSCWTVTGHEMLVGEPAVAESQPVYDYLFTPAFAQGRPVIKVKFNISQFLVACCHLRDLASFMLDFK